MRVSIKKLTETATIPTHGSRYAAGYDLYADLGKDVFGEVFASYGIKPHDTLQIKTGIAVELPPGFFGAIFARSGIATKRGLRPCNCVGVIDADYRGEVVVALHNDTDFPQEVKNGERIAQLVVIPYLPVDFVEVDELDDTERGAGGFGSTGV